MGFKLKRLKKSFKKTIKKVGKVAIKAVKYGAPVVGTLVGGPVGGLVGAGVGGVAATHRAKNKTAAFIRTVKYGAGVAAAGGLVNVAGGSNFFGSNVLGSVGSIFGGGASPKVNTGLDNALVTDADAGGSATGTLESLQNAFITGGGATGGGAPAADLGALANAFIGGGEGNALPTNPNNQGGSVDGQFGAGSGGDGVADGAGSGGDGVADGAGGEGLFQSPMFWIAAGVVVLFVVYNA